MAVRVVEAMAMVDPEAEEWAFKAPIYTCQATTTGRNNGLGTRVCWGNLDRQDGTIRSIRIIRWVMAKEEVEVMVVVRVVDRMEVVPEEVVLVGMDQKVVRLVDPDMEDHPVDMGRRRRLVRSSTLVSNMADNSNRSSSSSSSSPEEAVRSEWGMEEVREVQRGTVERELDRDLTDVDGDSSRSVVE